MRKDFSIFVGTAGIGGDDNGVNGVVQRSQDRGKSWQTLSFPVPPNTPVWHLATNPVDPNLIVCSTHYGQVFVSDDGGDAWNKIGREFSEIRSLAWTPN
jgi:photosystem II stability/assembly factor-like uncharacterized protein